MKRWYFCGREREFRESPKKMESGGRLFSAPAAEIMVAMFIALWLRRLFDL